MVASRRATAGPGGLLGRRHVDVEREHGGGSSVGGPARRARLYGPSVLVAVLSAAAVEWTWWLHPHGVLEGAAAPAAGVLLGVLLLLVPRRWPGPVAAAACSPVGVVAAPTTPAPSSSSGARWRPPPPRSQTAAPLRWYAAGAFRLQRVREPCALVAAAAVGGALGAAVETVAAGREHLERRRPLARRLAERGGDRGRHGRRQRRHADRDGTGAPSPNPRQRVRGRGPRRSRCIAVSVLALGHWNDTLAFSATLLLVWAALRFGPRGVAWSGIVMVAAADWAAARATGPFTNMVDGRDAATVLQVFVAITFFAMLGLALALDERDHAEAARAAATERFRRSFHDSPVAMAVTSLDGRIVETNRALCALLGQADHRLVGTNLRSYRPDDTGEHDVIRPGTAVAGNEASETRLVDAQGESVWVEISESRLRRLDAPAELQVVVLHNVTERKTLQQQLFHAEKMESVGRLAGGIAHDFNNVLAVMRGQVELLQDDLEVLESARRRIDSVQRATDRAAALTDDLMAFSRQRVDEPEPFDVHELLLGVQELLHQVLGSGVTLELELDAAPATLVADPNRLEQAVLNLVVNARDAMPSGGWVTIATRTEPAPACALVLTVSDTGARDGRSDAGGGSSSRSSPPSHRASAPASGLSTTDDIVRGAGGTIQVDSRRGHGTVFTLTFPALVSGANADDAEVLDLTAEEGDERPHRAGRGRRVRRAVAGGRDPARVGVPRDRRPRR